MICYKIKNLITRKDNNKNTFNISQKKENILLKTILYPMCYILVNTIYIVTYTQNYVIVILGTSSIYFTDTLSEITHDLKSYSFDSSTNRNCLFK